MNRRGDDEVDAKRSRPSIGKTRVVPREERARNHMARYGNREKAERVGRDETPALPALTQKLIQVLGRTAVSMAHISFGVGRKHLPHDTFGHFVSGSSVSV
jgi:hypothetical protein